MFDENNNIISEENTTEYENKENPMQDGSKSFQDWEKQMFKNNTLYFEKKDVRRTALGVGIPCLCLSLIGFVWSIVYIFFTVGVLKIPYNEAIEISQNPAMQQILQIVISLLMFLLPFSIAAKCMGIRIDQTVMFGKAKKGTFLPFLALGIGFCAFSNVAMSQASAIFEALGIDYDVDFGDNAGGIFGFLLTFIATAIVPALVEEFACRGIVLGLLKKHGEGFAIITSSVIFGIMHGNFEQIPFAIMVGLILGYIYVKTGSIWTCVAVHAVNNAVSVVFSYLDSLISTNLQNLLYIIYLAVGMLAAILAVYILAKRDKEDYAVGAPPEKSVSEKQKYTWFFTSWAIILFVVFNLLESLQYFVI
ncbi:MAG: type II CAAX endopeptidase family protein [Clostridia bacterium]|nr:type II CAAX endopeptidase family protein [Clostridia bacterium]